jgi:hypothetical protein
MAKEKLIDQNDSEESTKKSLFDNDARELTDNELKRLRSEFLHDIANNEGVIFEITVRSIKDDERNNGAPRFDGFMVRTIEVDSQSFKKRGFVSINNEIDLPLQRSRILSKGPWYFFSKEDAIEKYETLCINELKKIKKEEEKQEEIISDIKSQRTYMEELIANKRF